jgi:hypothetical protein
MSELHVFEFSDCDLVVAASVADAWAVLKEHNGEGFHDHDDLEGDARWEQLPDDREHGIWSYPDGAIAEHDADGAEVVRRTCAEWAALHGRGYLGSTEQ